MASEPPDSNPHALVALATLPALAVALDEDGRFLEVSEAWLDRLGLRRDEVLGRRVTAFLTAASQREAEEAGLPALLERGSAEGASFQMRSADGAWVEVRASATVQRDPAGRLERTILVLTDVAAQTRSGREQQRLLALLQGIVEATSDIIVARDLQLRTTFYNQAFARVTRALFGVHAAQGLRTLDYLPESARLHWERVFERVHSGDTHREEFEWSSGDEDARHYSLTLVPIREGDRVVGSAEFTRDVTERRQVQQQAESARQLEALGRLCAGVSHEYNNLLMGIVGYAHHLGKRVTADREATGFTESITELADQAAQVSRSLLDFARPAQGERLALALDDLVAETVRTFEPVLGEDMALELRLSSGARVEADPRQLQEVLINLLLNASDAMPEGGAIRVDTARLSPQPQLRRRLGLSAPGEHARLRVSDAGVGMTPEVRERVFEPFFTTKPPGTGTGLGLSAALGIITAHRGGVELQSAPGEGCQVALYLPILG